MSDYRPQFVKVDDNIKSCSIDIPVILPGGVELDLTNVPLFQKPAMDNIFQFNIPKRILEGEQSFSYPPRKGGTK